MDKVYHPHWINLDRDIRDHLRKVFSVGKSGITEVRDQTLITDGTTNEDLAHAFTLPAMCKYIGSEETFPRAWEITVSKAKYEVHPPVNMPILQIAGDVNSVTENATADNIPVLQIETPITDPARRLTAPKFCDLCDSGGIRHKKECTKPGLVNGFEREIPNIVPERVEVKIEGVTTTGDVIGVKIVPNDLKNENIPNQISG